MMMIIIIIIMMIMLMMMMTIPLIKAALTSLWLESLNPSLIKNFPNFADFNFFNFGQKNETKNPAPKQEKNMDDLMTQIDKLKKEVEEIKSQK